MIRKFLKIVQEHYENNEKDIHASNMLTSLDYNSWVRKIHNNAQIPDKDWRKSITYLVFDNNEKLIGLLNIRYELNEKMAMKLSWYNLWIILLNYW